MKKIIFLLMMSIFSLVLADSKVVNALPKNSKLSFFIGSPNDVVKNSFASKTWSSPDDISMTADVSWHDSGLMFDFTINDQEVINTKSVNELWQQDCIEIFFASVGEDKFGTKKSPIQLMQLLVSPPRNGVVSYFCGQNPKGVIKSSGKLTEKGYEIHLEIPKAFFGDYPWGKSTKFAMQMMIDDYDLRDGSAISPRSLNLNGQTALYKSPHLYYVFELTEQAELDREVDLRLYWNPTIPSVINTANLKFSTSRQLDIDSVEVLLESSDNSFSQKYNLDATSNQYTLVIPEAFPDGNYKLKISPKKSGKIIGQITKELSIIHKLTSWITSIDMKKLANEEPIKAVNVMALVSTIEAMKYTQAEAFINKLKQEAECRRALLENRPLPMANKSLNLLELTRNFEAQIAVEFSRSSEKATIVIPWGSLPMLNATVSFFDNAEAAQTYLLGEQNIHADVRNIALKGADYGFSGTCHYFGDGLRKDFNPETMVSIDSKYYNNKVYRIIFDSELYIVPQAVVIAPDTPKSMTDKVMDYAKKHNLPIIDFKDRKLYDLVLVAGNPVGNPYSDYRFSYYGTTIENLYFRKGNMVFETQFNNHESGIAFAEFLLANQPLTKTKKDELRELFIKPLNYVELADSDQGELFVGDMHTHTNYSDGSVNPAALLAEAAYVGFDFLTISDHNSVVGALLLKEDAKKVKFNMPLVVGEEITVNDVYHLNVYPLTKLIDHGTSFEKILKAAAEQNAIVQLNHPMTYGRYLASYWDKGNIVDANIVAVERNLANYERWKKADKSPIYTGSTDTHMGIFGHLDSTVVRCKNFTDDSLIEAFASRNVAMINPRLPKYVYGDNAMRQSVIRGLKQSTKLLEQHNKRIALYLQDINLEQYINNSKSN